MIAAPEINEYKTPNGKENIMENQILFSNIIFHFNFV